MTKTPRDKWVAGFVIHNIWTFGDVAENKFLFQYFVNYNLPDDLDAYIHRSGRTGRAGKSGISISIVHTREFGRIKSLERITKKPFERKPIPGGKEICKKQLFHLIQNAFNCLLLSIHGMAKILQALNY